MRTLSLAIFAAVLGLAAPFAAHAAGLGRLTVLSQLGAPLNAEIELVSLQPGEEDGLTARLASAEAFREAGIEPSAALNGVRLVVMRRDGKPIIRVTSPQPINEPFVDLLVELEWNGGRLVREYTFLLDPPEYKGSQAIAAAPERPAAPMAQPLPPLEIKPQAQVRPTVQEPAAPVAETSAEKPEAATPAGAVPSGAGTHEVKRGDTLGEIARAHLTPGVSLNQMLIAIYRANQDAFLRENINLLRTGRVLRLPTAEDLSAVNPEEANQLVQSHRAEWDEYRTRLAAVPVNAEAASGQRAVSGRIEAKPAETPPGPAQHQVRLSKADAAKPDAAARADDDAARERALKEAQSRVSDLEKNVADLQRLLELKNQQLAELEKKAEPKPAAKAPEVSKPAPPPAVAEAPKPAPVVTPAPEAKKAEAAKPKPKAAPPPPAAPSLLDEFLENPIALAGLGAVVALLLGYALWSWRRKKSSQVKFSDSVLGGSGAGAAATEAGATASDAGSQASVSQTSGMEAEEVDPIAEADVYMAYGRDAQAEEILKEALQKDSNRIPVHGKLLEIYAKRNDLQAFEQTALKLKNLTSGAGAEWDKAAALGRSIDPTNRLYGGSTAAIVATAAVATTSAAALATGTTGAPTIDFDIGGGTSSSMMTTDIPLEARGIPSTIDFDLGATSARVKDISAFPPPGDALNLDRPDPDATITSLDFDLNAGASDTPASPRLGEASGIDFDLNLDLGDKPMDAETSAPPMDLSSISLDLGSAAEAGGAPSNDPKWQEVATKLDLAKAYEEMGDKDGARELLGEVMKDGDATQKGQAQQLLTKLG